MTTEHNFEIGDVYEIDALPENQMNNSGKLQQVGGNLFALWTDDDKLIELERAGFRVTDVKTLDPDTGEIMASRADD